MKPDPRRSMLFLLFVAWIITIFAAPLAAEAQAAGNLLRVGYLSSGDRQTVYTAAFREGLRDAGHVEGRTLVVEYRFAEGKLDRLPALVEELLALEPDVVFASNPFAIKAIRNATTTVPVVGIDLENDPVRTGLAASLAHPGGHFTGIFLDVPEMAGKLVQLQKEIAPTRSSRIGVLWEATATLQFEATKVAAQVAGATVVSLPVKGPEDFNGAFQTAARERAHGLIVLSSPALVLHGGRIAELALKFRLPGISLFTLFPRSGLLAAYGPNLPDMFRRAAMYVDKIVKGAKPADLPIERPARFELVINLKTAKALGLTIPQSVLIRADQVIE